MAQAPHRLRLLLHNTKPTHPLPILQALIAVKVALSVDSAFLYPSLEVTAAVVARLVEQVGQIGQIAITGKGTGTSSTRRPGATSNHIDPHL